MLKRLSTTFTNLPVGGKLAVGFGALVALTLILGGALFYSGNLVNNMFSQVQQNAQQTKLAKEINTQLLEARRREKEFYLRYRNEGYETAFNNYAVTNQEALDRIHAAAAEAGQLADDPADAQAVAAIDASVTAYQDKQTAVWDLIRQRGTLLESGRLDQALSAFRELANQAAEVGAPGVEAAALRTLDLIWRYNILSLPGTTVGQDDQAVANRQTATENVLNQIAEVRTAIQQADIDASEAAQLLTSYQDAANKYDSLAELDDQILTISNDAQASAQQVAPAVDSYLAKAVEEDQRVAAQLADVQNFARTINIAVLVTSILTGITLALIITRSLTRQVAEIDGVFRSVGIGDFASRARVFGRDELGRTADGVNAMLEQLTTLLADAEAERAALQAAVEKLVRDVSELATGDLSINAEVSEGAITAAVAEALNYAIGELRHLVVGVEDAADQMTGASSSISQVVQLMAGQAASSADTAQLAARRAEEGSRAVSNTIAAMSRIRENTQETARRIKRLGEASQEISEVVRLIEEVADRTTVLALNASIQAAAAGDAGRGFAVVAEEVQRLAERAAHATRQIEGLVKSIQAETNEAMVGIEDATREVVDGSVLAQHAGDQMEELNQIVTSLTSLIQEVAQTTVQQTSESVTVLAELSGNLQTSVAAFKSPSNGHSNGKLN